MVAKKRNSNTSVNTAKKIKLSQEEPVAAQAPPESDPFLEFVAIKEEPLDEDSPPSLERQSPIDASPPKQSQKRSQPKKQKLETSVCELCLRKCPATLAVQFSLQEGNFNDGLQKLEHALRIQLELKTFSICRTCWKLVELTSNFRTSCLKVRGLRSQAEDTCREDGTKSDEWFSGKTSKAIEHTLQVVQSNLEYWELKQQKVDEIAPEPAGSEAEEDQIDDAAFNEPDVKDEDYAAAIDDLDENSLTTTNEDNGEDLEAKETPFASNIELCETELEKPTFLTPFPVYECKKCGRRFDSKNGHGLHLRRNAQSDTCGNSTTPLKSAYCCTTCVVYFKSKVLLKGHMDRHQGTKTLACRKGCGKMFYTGSTLRVHEHDCGVARSLVCPHCGVQFHSGMHMNRHLQQVHGEANLPCEICGKKFKTKETLARHINSHSTERKLSCSECGKMYKNSDSLRVHMRVHETNEQKAMPYGCDICGKRFRYGHAIRPHMLKEHNLRVAAEDSA